MGTGIGEMKAQGGDRHRGDGKGGWDWGGRGGGRGGGIKCWEWDR